MGRSSEEEGGRALPHPGTKPLALLLMHPLVSPLQVFPHGQLGFLRFSHETR